MLSQRKAIFKTGWKERQGWNYNGQLKPVRCLLCVALLSCVFALVHTKSLKISITKETKWENNDT